LICYFKNDILDNDGKIHVAFSVLLAKNVEEEYIATYRGITASFLSYWNEDMEPIDGETDFAYDKIYPKVYDYFDWELSDEHRLYVKSDVPEMPVIGYFIARNDHYFYIEQDEYYQWHPGCYGYGTAFSFPQMAFDKDNVLHLAYLGLLSGSGGNSSYFLHHPFYTTTADEGNTWTQTEHLVDNIEYINQEFAYLTLAGFDNNKMKLMAQVDSYPGTYIGHSIRHGCQDAPTINLFMFFSVKIETTAINNIEKTSLSMIVAPNPASETATVTFDGKGNITLYNMLGQTVYHIENVENEKVIPLNNIAVGVYFVTVRSENATATQKLIVR
jgi:hypothetical protein